jgi:hypothetical protein
MAAFIENARHFFQAFAERGPRDPKFVDDSVKMLDGIYLDFCRELGLDPDRQEIKRIAWTMALVGLKIADRRFAMYLKEKNYEAQQGMVSENGERV